jgi:predicted deacylase
MIITDISQMITKKGKKDSGWLQVSTRSDGSPLGIPVIIINGKKAGPTLLLEACCHGDETEGTLAIVKLMNMLNPDDIAGTVVAVPVLNIRAYEEGTRGNPDERYNYDMNRLFPGNAKGSVSERFVHAYFTNIVKKANYVVSLHGGGALFYLLNRIMISDDPKSIELGKAIGPDWRLLHESHHPNTLLNSCAEIGIPAVILERGGSNNRMPAELADSVDTFTKAVLNVMRYVKMLEGAHESAGEWGVLKGTNIRCDFGGLILLGEKCKIRNEVKSGDHLATIVDLFGNSLEVITAPQDGTILGVPASPVAYPGNNIITVAKIEKKVK